MAKAQSNVQRPPSVSSPAEQTVNPAIMTASSPFSSLPQVAPVTISQTAPLPAPPPTPISPLHRDVLAALARFDKNTFGKYIAYALEEFGLAWESFYPNIDNFHPHVYPQMVSEGHLTKATADLAELLINSRHSQFRGNVDFAVLILIKDAARRYAVTHTQASALRNLL